MQAHPKFRCLPLTFTFVLMCLSSRAGAGEDSIYQAVNVQQLGSVQSAGFAWADNELASLTHIECCSNGESAGCGCETATPAPAPYVGPLHSRSHLSGDWGGKRTQLAESGVTFDLYATQFYQGVTSGGLDRSWEYGGKLDYLLNIDGGKANFAPGLFINLHAETRFGGSVNPLTGQLSPPNVAMLFPDGENNTTAITGLKFTQALSEDFVVFGGKLNTLDEYPIHFSDEIGLERPGIGGFQNASLVFNPIMARTVPYSALGFGAAYLQGGIPVVSVTVFDPRERATIGVEDPFADGVTVVPAFLVAAAPFGKPGLLQFGGTFSNSNYTSLDRSSWELIPEVGITAGSENQSWSLFANGFQAVWVDPCDAKRVWGVFGQFGISDGNPNAVRYVANGGIAGRSMIRGRKLDTFGVGYFYEGLSNQFKALLAPVLPQQSEKGVEIFYNIALTPAARLTFDLQVAQPSTQGLNTVIVPGARFSMKF